ncbi:MAG: hypothetical protein LBG72_04810 [Spirochaetaceae bacterium]|jgi:hypothetical protein|nr:hypothetical protein [Spirochaetaceae bacterium]
MIVAYDDETGRLYKITMEPLPIKSLTEEAIFEVAATVLPKKEPDAEIKD